jgi:2-keto-4-pentenoate hydratase
MAYDQLRQLALCLLADYDARAPGRLFARPLELTAPQAYELQGEVARLREQRGEKIIGYKVGCTSRPIQEQLGVNEPIFGRLFETGCFRSGVRLSYARYANLAVEGELAVRLSQDLPSAPLADEEYLEAIETVFPVIELHDYVVPRAPSAGAQLIAQNGMHAGFVLAEETTCPGLPNSWQGLSVRIGDAVVGTDPESGTLSAPIRSLCWLATHLAEFGLRLSRGQLILTGSTLNLYPVGPGSRITVEAPPLGKTFAEVGP